jgi:hypothetical protein
LAALGSQVLSYGLVYPAAEGGSKLPLALSLLAGALLAALAGGLSLRAHRQAVLHSERFLALLGIVLSCFFLFVVVVGFGLPDLFLGTKD